MFFDFTGREFQSQSRNTRHRRKPSGNQNDFGRHVRASTAAVWRLHFLAGSANCRSTGERVLGSCVLSFAPVFIYFIPGLSAFVELERQVLTVTFYLESIQGDSCRHQ